MDGGEVMVRCCLLFWQQKKRPRIFEREHFSLSLSLLLEMSSFVASDSISGRVQKEQG
jgi:hypothetical protein